MLGSLITIFCFIISAQGYCLESDFPIIYHDPFKDHSKRSSYFGYSVILYGREHEESWIQMGAPRANSSLGVDMEEGMLVRCNMYGSCEQITVDSEPAGWTRRVEEWYFATKFKGWIGVSMDLSLKHNRTIVCGHRWGIVKQNTLHVDKVKINGICYSSKTYDTTYSKLLPILGKPDTYIEDAQIGFNAQFTDNVLPEFIAGAPGTGLWSGSMLRMQAATQYSRFSTHQLTSYRIPAIPEFSLNGYSVTSGHYFNKQTLYFATGGPRQNYYGQVVIFNMPNINSDNINIIDIKSGEIMGEYFGASLATGDINNDGFDDLIVGSPHYSSKYYNEGRVFIYLGAPKAPLRVPIRGSILHEKQEGGHFGLTVAFLGDLDEDSYGDIAVGSPYEEDCGVVYIYMGTNEGISPKYTQRIVGKNVYPMLKGFGISFSRPIDVDHNKYVDIAIGSYISGHAVLLRSKRSITLFVRVQSFSKQIDKEDRFINMQICHYFLAKYPPPYIKVERSITVDELLGRGTVDKNLLKSTIIINKNVKACDNITVELRNRSLQYNFYDPFTFTVKQKLLLDKPNKTIIHVYQFEEANRNLDKFNPHWAVYDVERSFMNWTETVPFALDCKNKQICHSSLYLTTKFSDVRDGNKYVLASKKYIQLQTIVENKGENAYFSQIFISAPPSVFYRQINSSCNKLDNGLICFLDNPIAENSKQAVTFDLDFEEINSGKSGDKLQFNISLLTNSNNTNHRNYSVELHLLREADLEITGISNKNEYFFGQQSNLINFTHMLRIQKYDVSPIDEVELEIDLPIGYKDKRIFLNITSFTDRNSEQVFCSNMEVFQYYVQENVPETSTSNIIFTSETPVKNIKTGIKGPSRTKRNVEEMVINCENYKYECYTLRCRLGPYTGTGRKSISDLLLKMVFNATHFSEQERKQIIFQSSARVKVAKPFNFKQSGSRPDIVKVVSIFTSEPKAESVSAWIIFVGILIGLLLLALLAFGLMKVGFFKRAHKEEMYKVQQEKASKDECREAHAVEFEEQQQQQQQELGIDNTHFSQQSEEINCKK